MPDRGEEADRRLRRALEDPASFGATGEVRRIDTHLATVYLAGSRAYKLYRPVDYPYANLATSARRHAVVEQEVTANQRTAPGLYLGVAPLFAHDGTARAGSIGDDGSNAGAEPADWLVVMRRFAEETLFDRMARRGDLSARLIEQLVDRVVDMHEAAPVAEGFGGSAHMRRTVEEATSQLTHHAGTVFRRERVEATIAGLSAALDANTDLIDRRKAAGLVIEGHGDLHLRNICLVDDIPTPFDAIAFNPRLAAVDRLYDLAFLLMDLRHRGLPGHAAVALERYLGRIPDHAGLAALPFFIALRAAISAHTTASVATAEGNERLAENARAYITEILESLGRTETRLIAIGGLSGSGKTTVARALAPAIGACPGAVVVRTDLVRKRLMGVSPETRLPQAAYAPEVSAQVHDTLFMEAASALDAGHGVILDATFIDADIRARAQATAAEAGVPFVGLWLSAAEEARVGRVSGRSGDASDAGPRIAAKQTGAISTPPAGWQTVDASGPVWATVAAARKVVQDSG